MFFGNVIMLGQAPGGSLSNVKALLKSSLAARGRFRSCQAQKPMQADAWRSNIVSSPEEAVEVKHSLLVTKHGYHFLLSWGQARSQAICLQAPSSTQIAREARLVGVLGIAPEAKVNILFLVLGNAGCLTS